MKLLTRSIVLAHRYLGIVISLLVIMWFATGIRWMYAGCMPRLSEQLRLERLTDLDLTRVRLTPADAAARLAVDVRRAQLVSLVDRPVYRIDGATIYADTGDVL